MNVKRFLVLGILGLFLVSMMGGVLGALGDDARDFSEGVVDVVGGLFGPILEPFFGEKEMLTRIFFALLLGMIIYSIVLPMFKVKKKSWIAPGITIAITSLALLGLPSGFLETIRTQYGAMGATILTIIPFIIILTFSLKARSILVARLTWIFYAVYYFAMYGYLATTTGGFFTTESMPYGIAFFAGIFIFFGIGGIRKLIFKGEIEGIVERGNRKIKTRAALQNIQDKDLGRYNIS